MVILFWRGILMVVWKCLILCQIIVICDCMRWKWFNNKELGFLMIWSQGTLSVVFSPVNNCFSGKKGKVFFIASWRVMKNGFITATQREESHGDCPVILLRRRLGRIFTLWRLCCVFGWTTSVLFIMNCWTKRNHHWGTVSNAIDAFEPSTTRKTATIRAEETLKWEVLPHSPYSPDIAPSNYYLFRSMAHGLADQQFRSYEDIEKCLDSWIASKD